MYRRGWMVRPRYAKILSDFCVSLQAVHKRWAFYFPFDHSATIFQFQKARKPRKAWPSNKRTSTIFGPAKKSIMPLQEHAGHLCRVRRHKVFKPQLNMLVVTAPTTLYRQQAPLLRLHYLVLPIVWHLVSMNGLLHENNWYFVQMFFIPASVITASCLPTWSMHVWIADESPSFGFKTCHSLQNPCAVAPSPKDHCWIFPLYAHDKACCFRTHQKEYTSE